MNKLVTSPRIVGADGFEDHRHRRHHTVREAMFNIPIPRAARDAVFRLADDAGLTLSEWLYVAISAYPVDAWRQRARAGHRVLTAIMSLENLRDNAKAKAARARTEYVAGDRGKLIELAHAEVKAAEYERIMSQYVGGVQARPSREERMVSVTVRVDAYTAASLHAHSAAIGIRATPFIRLILMEVLASRGYAQIADAYRLGGVRDGIAREQRRGVYENLLSVLARGGFEPLTVTKVVEMCERCRGDQAVKPALAPVRLDQKSALRSRILRAPIEAERLLRLPPRPQRKAA